MEELVHKLTKTSVIEAIIWLLINFVPWLIYGLVKAIYSIFRKNSIYNDMHKSGRVKDVLSSIAENKARLGASHVIITRIHNGIKWLNGDHMNKISVYKQLTVFKRLYFTSKLDNVKLSEISELIGSLIKRDDDIISVNELPSNFEFKQILKMDKVKYLIIFKIQKSKILLGYIFLLYQGNDSIVRDEAVFKDYRRIASEIAKEFA